MEIFWLVIEPCTARDLKTSRVRKQELVEIPPHTRRKAINKETYRGES